MNKYRLVFAGTPGTEMLVTGYDIPSVASQYQYSASGQLLRVEFIGSTNVVNLLPEVPAP